MIASNGIYLHVEEPCAGLRDFIYVEATIEDVFINEKFEKMYGKPEIDDYKRVSILEEEIKALENKAAEKDKALNKPLIKFLLKLFE